MYYNLIKELNMKMRFFAIVFLVISSSCFAQTWTIRWNYGRELGEIDVTYTVITKQHYDRLLRQNTELGKCGRVDFTDSLELIGLGGSSGESLGGFGRVINGTAPSLRGYFYILVNSLPRTEATIRLYALTGIGTDLMYGNSNTGYLTIAFGNDFFGKSDGAALLSSNTFIQRYSQCIRYVNGE
jgi:hypothetical protein